MPLPKVVVAWLATCMVVLTASAMSVVAPTFSELVAESDTIIRGTVRSIRTEEFDSPQGRAIRTLVTLQVERVLKGAPGSELTLTLLGGTVGRRTMSLVGMPEFRVGERQVVFVARNGRVFCPLVGIRHGRYHVRTDGATGREFIARDNGAPMRSTDEVVMPLDIPAAVTQRINAASALATEEFETWVSNMALQQELGRSTR